MQRRWCWQTGFLNRGKAQHKSVSPPLPLETIGKIKEPNPTTNLHQCPQTVQTSSLPIQSTTTTTALASALAPTATMNPSLFGEYLNTTPPNPLPQTTEYYIPPSDQDDTVYLDSSSLLAPSNRHPTGKYLSMFDYFPPLPYYTT